MLKVANILVPTAGAAGRGRGAGGLSQRSATHMRFLRVNKKLKVKEANKGRKHRELQAQIMRHNLKNASRADYNLVVPGQAREKVEGVASWKKHEPRSALRTAFAEPATPTRVLAKQIDPPAATSHISCMQNCAAELLLQGQKAGSDSLLEPASKHKWIIGDVALDESKFKVHLQNEMPLDHSILAAHGGLIARTSTGELVDETVVHPPRAMEANNAKAMWAHLNESPAPIVLPSSASELRGSIIRHDRHKANLKLDAGVYANLPEDHLLGVSNCKQHATPNVIASPTKILGLTGGAFCTAKTISDASTFSNIKAAIEKRVDQMPIREENDFAPDPEHVEYADALLESSYYRRDLHMQMAVDPARADVLAAEDQKRRALGGELKQFFPGDWRTAHGLFHVCPTGCCLNEHGRKDKRVTWARAKSLLFSVVILLVTVPALNKWTALDKAFGTLTMGTMCRLLPYAVGRALSKDKRQPQDEAAQNLEGTLADEQAGPVDQLRQHNLNEYRRQSAVRWAMSMHTLIKLLVWTCLATHVMAIHFTLFSEGQLSTAPLDAEGEELDKRLKFLCELADPAASVAARALRQYLEMLADRRSGGWRTLHAYYGGREWPASTVRLARGALLKFAGLLWRLLIRAFKLYPWKLCALVNPESTREQRLKCAQELFDMPECCLDIGVARRLRNKFSKAEDLLEPDVLDFLKHFFAKMTLSTQFVECVFALYGRWVMQSPKPLSMWCLGRKHVCHFFMRRHQDLSAKRFRGMNPSEKTRLARPAWVRVARRKQAPGNKNSKANTTFVGRQLTALKEKRLREGGSALTPAESMSAAWAEWRAAAPAAKSKAKGQARTSKAQAVVFDPLEKLIAELQQEEQDTAPGQGPWALGNGVFPLAVDSWKAVSDKKAGIEETSTAFVTRLGKLILPDGTFPDDYRYEKSCLEIYPECLKSDAMTSDDLKGKIDAFVGDIKVALETFKTGKRPWEQDPPILGFSATGMPLTLVQMMDFRLTSPLEAEAFFVDTPTPMPELPFDLRTPLMYEDAIKTEADVAKHLLERSHGPWAFHICSYEPLQLDVVKITAITEVDIGERKAAKAENRRTKRTIALMKRMLQPWHKVRKKTVKPKVALSAAHVREPSIP